MHLNLEEDKLALNDKLSKFHKLYDYIIIGSGPAASVVLNNLIKTKKKILVVERGGFKKKFNENLGSLFSLEYEQLSECFIFLNSGGVTSKTFYVPLPEVFLQGLNLIDKFLIKLFPNLFCMGRRIVLKKNNL